MRIIKRTTIKQWADQYRDAATALASWVKVVEGAGWKNFAELRKTYTSADLVKVGPGRDKNAIVFDIRGNTYRMITAVHFDRQRVFVMLFLTHKEYDKNTWKDQL
jgi:mRNA interferase HigB